MKHPQCFISLDLQLHEDIHGTPNRAFQTCSQSLTCLFWRKLLRLTLRS